MIRDEDLEYTFYRSSGPGGQKKNTADTAVRLRHIPTGIVVVSQRERSQHRNKQIALEELERRLEILRRPRRLRIATRMSRAAKARRLESKRRRGVTKRLRGSLPDE